MKYFIITVDTEGDNLWSYEKGAEVQTENTLYIPRFQRLCEKYGFKPVYLTNWEMLNDERFIAFAKQLHDSGNAEIGFHLHAWNNPPEYSLDGKFSGNPFLVEYPDDVMMAKFDALYKLFMDKLGFKPFSHRAGRWAMDERYFRILHEYGIKVDCSVTPGINWANTKGETRGGTDYSHAEFNVSAIGDVLEVPMSIRKIHHCSAGSLKHRVKTLLAGDLLWMRPATQSLQEMKLLVDKIHNEKNTDYLEFMIHSSELMPNGSPYFKDDKAIENLYETMDKVFTYVKNKRYTGVTLKEYYNHHINN